MYVFLLTTAVLENSTNYHFSFDPHRFSLLGAILLPLFNTQRYFVIQEASCTRITYRIIFFFKRDTFDGTFKYFKRWSFSGSLQSNITLTFVSVFLNGIFYLVLDLHKTETKENVMKWNSASVHIQSEINMSLSSSMLFRVPLYIFYKGFWLHCSSNTYSAWIFYPYLWSIDNIFVSSIILLDIVKQVVVVFFVVK